jgi:hypothetical protein
LYATLRPKGQLASNFDRSGRDKRDRLAANEGHIVQQERAPLEGHDRRRIHLQHIREKHRNGDAVSIANNARVRVDTRPRWENKVWLQPTSSERGSEPVGRLECIASHPARSATQRTGRLVGTSASCVALSQLTIGAAECFIRSAKRPTARLIIASCCTLDAVVRGAGVITNQGSISSTRFEVFGRATDRDATAWFAADDAVDITKRCTWVDALVVVTDRSIRSCRTSNEQE